MIYISRRTRDFDRFLIRYTVHFFARTVYDKHSAVKVSGYPTEISARCTNLCEMARDNLSRYDCGAFLRNTLCLFSSYSSFREPCAPFFSFFGEQPISSSLLIWCVDEVFALVGNTVSRLRFFVNTFAASSSFSEGWSLGSFVSFVIPFGLKADLDLVRVATPGDSATIGILTDGCWEGQLAQQLSVFFKFRCLTNLHRAYAAGCD